MTEQNGAINLTTGSTWKNIFSGMRHVSVDLLRKILLLSWPTALIQISWNAGNIFLYNILSRLQEGNITAMATVLTVQAVQTS